MAKKKVAAVVKIQIPAGRPRPAPPVGTALGPHGVAIMDFCKAYNARTEASAARSSPSRSRSSRTARSRSSPQDAAHAVLIRQAAGLDKAANNPGKEVAGSITEAQLEEIARSSCPTSTPTTRRRQAPGRRHRPLDGHQVVLSTVRRLRRPPARSTGRPGSTSPGPGITSRGSGSHHGAGKKYATRLKRSTASTSSRVGRGRRAGEEPGLGQVRRDVELSPASASTPARPTRWSAAPSRCPRAPARTSASPCSPPARPPTPPARPAPTSWAPTTSPPRSRAACSTSTSPSPPPT
jgi:large subunit ribosomal protein L11